MKTLPTLLLLLASSALAEESPTVESSAQSTAASGATEPPVIAEPPDWDRLDQRISERFVSHEPIYFLYGSAAQEVKFQISFKYRLAGKAGESTYSKSAAQGLYLGYTQRSLWDVSAESSPFYDTSYIPELFYEWRAAEQRTTARVHWLGVRTGVLHESNGKADAQAHSLNTFNVRSGIVFGSAQRWHLQVVPRIYSYTNTDSDLVRYRGHGDLTLQLSKNNSTQVGVMVRAAKLQGRGSVEVNVTQPVRWRAIDLRGYVQLQYFHGYGESLRDYDRKSSAWRAGIAFVR